MRVKVLKTQANRKLGNWSNWVRAIDLCVLAAGRMLKWFPQMHYFVLIVCQLDAISVIGWQKQKVPEPSSDV